ncbi:hypothetical protein KBY28_20550 [Ruegeria pomeroyi]|uniref:hypothetical protein n=1 Tax=Ruegeria pomeroyi TaxID=89184 RepID=UPI001F492C06|nr:hypothetical protein [Ruegeria pomeroyi]MCE8510849.1 hypothetical protein [Ruegeria pomeroyi]
MLRILKQLIATISVVAFLTTSSHAMFIQPDWLDPTKPGVGTNRYAYSYNDPVNNHDPNGNACAPCAVQVAIEITKWAGVAFLGLLGIKTATEATQNPLSNVATSENGPGLSSGNPEIDAVFGGFNGKAPGGRAGQSYPGTLGWAERGARGVG